MLAALRVMFMNGTRLYGGPVTTEMSNGPELGSDFEVDLATNTCPYLTCTASKYCMVSMLVTVWLLREMSLRLENNS